MNEMIRDEKIVGIDLSIRHLAQDMTARVELSGEQFEHPRGIRNVLQRMHQHDQVVTARQRFRPSRVKALKPVNGGDFCQRSIVLVEAVYRPALQHKRSGSTRGTFAAAEIQDAPEFWQADPGFELTQDDFRALRHPFPRRRPWA